VDFTIFLSKLEEEECLIKTDPAKVKMLAVQSAVSIIAACRNYPVAGGDIEDPTFRDIFRSRLRWGSEGHIKAMLAQIELLHSFVAEVVKFDEKSEESVFQKMVSKSEAELFTQALQDFQDLKTKLCEEGQEEWTEDVTLSGYDWTDLNKKLSALFE